MADGLKTALAEELLAFGMEPGAVEREQQLMLIEDRMEAAEVEARKAPADGKRGPGRPKNSPNRSTEQWRKLLFAKHGSPLDAILTEANKSIADLMAEYDFKPKEAAHYRMNALQAALPYMHQKQPIAVEAPPGSMVNFNLVLGEAAGEQASADPASQVFGFQRAPDAADAEVIEGDRLPAPDPQAQGLESDEKTET